MSKSLILLNKSYIFLLFSWIHLLRGKGWQRLLALLRRTLRSLLRLVFRESKLLRFDVQEVIKGDNQISHGFAMLEVDLLLLSRVNDLHLRHSKFLQRVENRWWELWCDLSLTGLIRCLLRQIQLPYLSHQAFVLLLQLVNFLLVECDGAVIRQGLSFTLICQSLLFRLYLCYLILIDYPMRDLIGYGVFEKDDAAARTHHVRFRGFFTPGMLNNEGWAIINKCRRWLWKSICIWAASYFILEIGRVSEHMLTI